MQFNYKSELFKKVRFSFYMLVVNDPIDTMSIKWKVKQSKCRPIIYTVYLFAIFFFVIFEIDFKNIS